mmetsp:Transcript_33261/g.51015  ORF Transcript_33261/g.51015 Transcript_33261/m.51015 type:complete len:222 (-) Transcript_33261:163-828(-)
MSDLGFGLLHHVELLSFQVCKFILHHFELVVQVSSMGSNDSSDTGDLFLVGSNDFIEVFNFLDVVLGLFLKLNNCLLTFLLNVLVLEEGGNVGLHLLPNDVLESGELGLGSLNIRFLLGQGFEQLVPLLGFLSKFILLGFDLSSEGFLIFSVARNEVSLLLLQLGLILLDAFNYSPLLLQEIVGFVVGSFDFNSNIIANGLDSRHAFEALAFAFFFLSEAF